MLGGEEGSGLTRCLHSTGGVLGVYQTAPHVTMIRTVVPNRLLSWLRSTPHRGARSSSRALVATALQPAGVYDLRATPNVAHVEEWRIFHDFVRVLTTATVPDIARFHARHVVPYEAYLRGISPTLVFEDGSYRRGAPVLLPLTFDVCARLMERALREAITTSTDTPRTRAMIDWALSVPHGDPAHIGYAVSTLLCLGRHSNPGARQLALYLVTEKDGAFPRYLPHTCLFREALHGMDEEMCRALYARGYLTASEQSRSSLRMIASDLRGEGYYAWAGMPADARDPFLAWVLALPELGAPRSPRRRSPLPPPLG